MSLRPPPHNVTVERVVLGSMFINPKCIPKVRKFLNPDDFYHEAHQSISKAIFELKLKATLITVAEWLDHKGLLEKLGGRDYLASFVADVATSAGVEHHAKIVKSSSKRRKIISQCSVTTERAHGVFDDINEILSEHKAGIRGIENDQQDTIPSNKKLLMEIMDDLEKGGDDHTVGVLTGLKNIDDNLNGLEPKTTYCLIAESGMAKSALALNIGDHIALNYPGKVLYFTLESTSVALTRRRLAKHSNVALTRLRNRNIRGEWEWENITKACNVLSEENLVIIDDTFYQTIENLSAFCESLAMDEKIELIIIDYIQLMSSTKRFNSRHLEISHISKQINFLAKDLNIPVLVISQLGKDVEKRTRKEPMLSDIKECVAGGTEVYTNKGPRSIKYLYERTSRNFKIKSYDVEKKKTVFIKPEKILHTGIKRGFRLRTKSGKILSLSGDTPLLTNDGWVKCKNLKIGDKIIADCVYKRTRRGVCFNSGRTHLSWKKTFANKKPKRFGKIYPILGTKKSNRGYVLIYMPDWPSASITKAWHGYVFEHRYIMEKHLGRSLERHEYIHHWNGDKLDNRLENLRLCKGAKEHSLIHQKEQRFVEDLIKKEEVYYDENKGEFRFR